MEIYEGGKMEVKDVVENGVLDEKEYQRVKKIFNKSSDYFTKKEIEKIFLNLNKNY